MSYNADSIQIKDFRSACNIGKIYKIVDKTNDKIYIGQTINTLEYRFKQHARTPWIQYKLIVSIMQYKQKGLIILLLL